MISPQKMAVQQDSVMGELRERNKSARSQLRTARQLYGSIAEAFVPIAARRHPLYTTARLARERYQELTMHGMRFREAYAMSSARTQQRRQMLLELSALHAAEGARLCRSSDGMWHEACAAEAQALALRCEEELAAGLRVLQGLTREYHEAIQLIPEVELKLGLTEYEYQEALARMSEAERLLAMATRQKTELERQLLERSQFILARWKKRHERREREKNREVARSAGVPEWFVENNNFQIKRKGDEIHIYYGGVGKPIGPGHAHVVVCNGEVLFHRGQGLKLSAPLPIRPARP